MLEVVVHRAAARQRRRVLAGSGACAAVVLVAGLVTVVARGPSGDGDGLRVASGGASTSTAAGPTTTATIAPPLSSVPVPEVLPFDPTTTSAPPATTAPATTAPAPATTTTQATAPPTTAPPTTVPADCGPGHVRAEAAVEKAVYQPGEWVVATGSVRHVGTAPCPMLLVVSSSVSWVDAAGTALYGLSVVGSCLEPCLWNPGEVRPARWCWDQRAVLAGGGQVAPGRYGARLSWGQIEATDTFEIAAGTPVASPRPAGCP
jgi:hypothetical protein